MKFSHKMRKSPDRLIESWGEGISYWNWYFRLLVSRNNPSDSQLKRRRLRFDKSLCEILLWKETALQCWIEKRRLAEKEDEDLSDSEIIIFSLFFTNLLMTFVGLDLLLISPHHTQRFQVSWVHVFADGLLSAVDFNEFQSNRHFYSQIAVVNDERRKKIMPASFNYAFCSSRHWNPSTALPLLPEQCKSHCWLLWDVF